MFFCFQNMSTRKAAAEAAGRRTRASGMNSGNLADNGERIRGVRAKCQKPAKGINGLFFLCRRRQEKNAAMRNAAKRVMDARLNGDGVRHRRRGPTECFRNTTRKGRLTV